MEPENLEILIPIFKKLKEINEVMKKAHPNKWKANMEPFREAIQVTMCITQSHDIINAMTMIRQKMNDHILICWLEATAYQMMLDKHNAYCHEH